MLYTMSYQVIHGTPGHCSWYKNRKAIFLQSKVTRWSARDSPSAPAFISRSDNLKSAICLGHLELEFGTHRKNLATDLCRTKVENTQYYILHISLVTPSCFVFHKLLPSMISCPLSVFILGSITASLRAVDGRLTGEADKHMNGDLRQREANK